MTQTLGLDHLGLTVADLEASCAFFVDAMGWQVFGGNPDYPSVYVTDGHVKFTLWQQKIAGSGFDRQANVGLHHVALKVADEVALNALFERVRTWPGVEVEFDPEFSGHGPKMHFMIREPGGTRLEVAYDPR